MSSRFFKCLMLAVALAATTAGCNVQFVNTPTDNVIIKDLKIVGDYRIENGTGPLKDATVSIVRNDGKYPFSMHVDFSGPPKDDFLCQTYGIEDTNIVFVKYAKKGLTKNWLAFRIEVKENQIVANAIRSEFFGDNPNELMQIPGDRKKGVLIGSDSAKLDAFFEKHSKSNALFDHEKPMILNRINKVKN